MNMTRHTLKPIAAALTALTLAACASAPSKPAGADLARSELTRLESDPQLADRAPLAIRDAEVAVRAAEVPEKDTQQGQQLVFIANHKVAIARAEAEQRLAEEKRKGLSDERNEVRLDARTAEADNARTDAEIARTQADSASRTAAASQQQSADLQRQLGELNAKTTERGLVVTLGDVLFDTNQSSLKASANTHLSKLAIFLNRYPDRTVLIEGYTDSVGSDSYNLSLSQRRADAVKTFLVGQGVSSSHLSTSGKGKSAPVADNGSESGRQQNRRVEVIITNANAGN